MNWHSAHASMPSLVLFFDASGYVTLRTLARYRGDVLKLRVSSTQTANLETSAQIGNALIPPSPPRHYTLRSWFEPVCLAPYIIART